MRLMKDTRGRGTCVLALQRLFLIILCTSCGATCIGAPVTGVPIAYVTNTYLHPARGTDTYFGYTADISSKYVAVLGRRGTQSVATEYNAFVFDAATGEHLWTLTQPVPSDNVNFRFASIAIDGDLAVIGATFAHVTTPGGGISYNSGAAYVYDLNTGQLKHKLVSDSPQRNLSLGTSVDILGDRIAVGGRDYAFVFDAVTGDQLARLNPSAVNNQFGISVALSESAVVVGANSDSSGGETTGAVFTFDLDTYTEISRFIPVDAPTNENFGFKVAVDGRRAIASGQSGAYIFDVETGTQVTKLTLPGGSSTYPYSVEIRGATALLGDPIEGRAMIFDWSTGEALQELRLNEYSNGIQFGASVSIAGDTAIVAAKEAVYQYNIIPEPSSVTLLCLGTLMTTGSRRLRS